MRSYCPWRRRRQCEGFGNCCDQTTSKPMRELSTIPTPAPTHGMKKVIVLLHEDDAAFGTNNYAIAAIMKHWQAKGLAVEIVRGTARFVPGDVVIPHVDLTVTPPEYREFLKQYPVVINEDVVDISKSRISGQLVARDDDYGGPVIVKADRNYGGLPEKRLSDLRRPPSFPVRLARRVMRKLQRQAIDLTPWRHIQYLEPRRYSVFPSLQAVPGGVFKNRNLIVERFLPEFEDGYHCLRSWFFFGDKGTRTLLRSRKQVVKLANSIQVEGSPAPPELRPIREQLGFDYGKFDYVVHEGKAVLLDVNRTPAIAQSPLGREVTRLLAEGIWSKLK